MSIDVVRPLRLRMIEDMTARKLSAGTQRLHISSCKRFDLPAVLIVDQDIRSDGWSAPSSSENSTGMISFVAILPFTSFSAKTSCWASGRPTGITILPPALSWLIRGGGSGRAPP